MLEQISTSLFNQTSELHFLKGALNNLEKVLHWQKEQKDSQALEVLSMDMLEKLQTRKAELEHSVAALTEKQTELYKSTYGNPMVG
jgi:CRISPR/Cas system CSM-associated protein Csm4 (group 5 of RAMP superfamily)